MNEMERGTICEMKLQGRIRGMSYGQYVAARYYPVTVVEELPDGGEIVRRAALPEVLPGYEETADRIWSADAPARPKKPKRERLCAVCGEPLGQYQRRYCGDGCRVKSMEALGCSTKGYKKAPRVDKPCEVCGKLMQGVLPRQKYCCRQCRDIGNYRKQREWIAANPPEKKERYCQVCGIRIEDGGYKYCPDCAAAEIARRNRERWKRRNREE